MACQKMALQRELSKLGSSFQCPQRGQFISNVRSSHCLMKLPQVTVGILWKTSRKPEKDPRSKQSLSLSSVWFLTWSRHSNSSTQTILHCTEINTMQNVRNILNFTLPLLPLSLFFLQAALRASHIQGKHCTHAWVMPIFFSFFLNSSNHLNVRQYQNGWGQYK